MRHTLPIGFRVTYLLRLAVSMLYVPVDSGARFVFTGGHSAAHEGEAAPQELPSNWRDVITAGMRRTEKCRAILDASNWKPTALVPECA